MAENRCSGGIVLRLSFLEESAVVRIWWGLSSCACIYNWPTLDHSGNEPVLVDPVVVPELSIRHHYTLPRTQLLCTAPRENTLLLPNENTAKSLY